MHRKEIRSRLGEIGNLLAGELDSRGYWTGELSSSALAVAVALTALHFDDHKKHYEEINKGLSWLAANINDDGSFGDTPESPGNVSTSLLVYAAINLQEGNPVWLEKLKINVSRYLNSQGINVNTRDVAKNILKYYDNDYTFSVPILTMCGLCGIPDKNAFDNIPQLPFELLLLPGSFYRLLNLNVVSYALPALAAVGIVIFRNKKPGVLLRVIRHFSISRALRKLHRMMPESGGYLEAVPLTAFVSLSLINAGYGSTNVVKKGIGFLKRLQREDGSWPVDVDLSTWVTSLSIKSFRSNLNSYILPDNRAKISLHLRSIQNKDVHPFNGTPPGGWGWTSYSGSVPDGDDTPGVILALSMLETREEVRNEVLAGGRWLLGLQNNDGGFPTFSRGWGKLPFDQSCPDLTGHCLLALSLIIGDYKNVITPAGVTGFKRSFNRALKYLEEGQHHDGSWLPLWFGNQLTNKQTNPLYGTAKVTAYLRDVLKHNWYNDKIRSRLEKIIGEGAGFIISIRNDNGSWGGAKSIPGSIEETSLAVSALASQEYKGDCLRGLEWIDGVYARKGLITAPIGLYFASLWYDEKLYPVTFYLEALARMLELPEE